MGNRFSFSVVRALTTSTSDTILQLLAATNHEVKIERISITGKSNSAADAPVEFNVLRQTSAGTGGSSVTGSKFHTGGDTLDVTATKGDYSVEPTDSGDIVLIRHVHPISGHDIVFPPGRELVVKAGERLGIKAITPGQGSTYAVTIEGAE
jgi:hypothetical protein